MNGKNEAPLYKFLKLQKGGLFGNGIKWNFTKFLVNKEGKVVERYAPVTSPLKIEVRLLLWLFVCLYLVNQFSFADDNCWFIFLCFVQKDIQSLLESSWVSRSDMFLYERICIIVCCTGVMSFYFHWKKPFFGKGHLNSKSHGPLHVITSFAMLAFILW